MSARWVLLVSISMLFAITACGGSASETPPPLQPDPMGFRYASAPIARPQDGDGGLSTIANEPDPENDPQPVAPAPAEPAPPR